MFLLCDNPKCLHLTMVQQMTVVYATVNFLSHGPEKMVMFYLLHMCVRLGR